MPHHYNLVTLSFPLSLSSHPSTCHLHSTPAWKHEGARSHGEHFSILGSLHHFSWALEMITEQLLYQTDTITAWQFMTFSTRESGSSLATKPTKVPLPGAGNLLGTGNISSAFGLFLLWVLHVKGSRRMNLDSPSGNSSWIPSSFCNPQSGPILLHWPLLTLSTHVFSLQHSWIICQLMAWYNILIESY